MRVDVMFQMDIKSLSKTSITRGSQVVHDGGVGIPKRESKLSKGVEMRMKVTVGGWLPLQRFITEN